jgi:hypothetical protein
VFFPTLLALPFTSPNVAGAAEPAAPAQGDDGNWRVAGRARVGTNSTAVVWHEIDTGDIQIWKVDDEGQLTDFVDFNVGPPWQLKALQDLDGDGIADWIWTNSLFDASFFWLMNDFDSFDPVELNNNPAELVRYGQWFNGMPLNELDGSASFELVAADHFTARARDGFETSGREQAASDLVWQHVDGEATVIWSMALIHRTCDEIADPLILVSCLALGGGSVLTYELSHAAAAFTRPVHWRLSGTADYNIDGQPDLVWHARHNPPTEEAGHVQLWLSKADGGFNEVTVTRDGIPFIVDANEGQEVSVR